MSKKRLDILLVERDLAENQDSAKRIIMAGQVYTEQLRLDKPGMKVDEDLPLSVKGKSMPYVGRGGLKLEKALKLFNLNVHNKTMVDVGSSTGGFTDCALQNGLRLSYAIDVGYNQLDWKLRNDKRVVVMERTNFRYVTSDMLKFGMPDLAVIDVSFISLQLILPTLKRLLEPNSDVITLIKPQFEAEREQVGNKGIVKDKEVHSEVLHKIVSFAINEGYEFKDITYSPITGGDGNIEFLALFNWPVENKPKSFPNDKLQMVIEDAHSNFNIN